MMSSPLRHRKTSPNNTQKIFQLGPLSMKISGLHQWSRVNNLMVFKNSGLGLEKISGLAISLAVVMHEYA